MVSCLPISRLEGWKFVGILAGARVGIIGGERAGGSSAKSSETQPMGVKFDRMVRLCWGGRIWKNFCCGEG